MALIRQYNAHHVIVRLPQRVESQAIHDRARGQIETVMGMVGVTLGGYGWLYRDEPPQNQANDWCDFLEKESTSVPVLWMDEEPYQTNDNLASIDQMKQCASQLMVRGWKPGVYSGPWVWSLLRNVVDAELSALPLLTAEYNGKATLTDVNLYGGWTTCAGHQYSSQGVDQDIMDSRFV